MTGPLLVLAGGLSHERDVSLRSGRRVAEALRSVGHEVIERDVDADVIRWAAENRPACVIPMLHGETGEDGALREVLDLLGLPYVGTSAAASRTAFDKPIAKTLIEAAGLRTPRSVALPHDAFREWGAAAVMDAVVRQLGLPLFVKPARGGSALGASVVREAKDLAGAMVEAYAYGTVALIEQFVVGTEVAVPVITAPGLPSEWPVVQIEADGGVYDYTARYTAGATTFTVPAPLSSEATQRAQAAASTAHTALGLRDWSRSDLIIDDNEEVWFLEVNVAPGCTETSLLPLSVESAGWSLGEVVSQLAAQALTRGS